MRRRAPILAPLLLAVFSVSAAAPSGNPYMRVDSVVVNATPAPRLPTRTAVDWCGVDQPAVVDRKPETDLSSIRQVHITYVIPADAPDRFRSRVGPIATDVAAIDAWWRGQDASRTIRFDRYAFAGCTTTFGALDIGFLQLSQAGSAYVGEEGLDQLLRDLTRFESLPWHKHLVYYDGQNPFDDSVCGTTLTNRFTRGVGGVDGVSFFWLGSLCGIDLGAGGLAASVAVHELIHGLGALSEGSPHECAPPNRAHVCDSTADILTPFATGETRLATQVLDVNRDDYYDAAAPPWFDVRGYSAWLSHLPQLPIQVNATGSLGTIRVSSPSDFDCGRSCTLQVDTGATLTFIAMPGPGARLVGWSGACNGAGACTVTVDGAPTVTATFGPASRLTVVVRGKGRVVSAPFGISCPGSCSATFAPGTKVRLRATPAAGWRFAGWTGGCRSTRPCIVTADRSRSVRATFGRR